MDANDEDKIKFAETIEKLPDHLTDMPIYLIFNHDLNIIEIDEPWILILYNNLAKRENIIRNIWEFRYI